MYLAIAAMEDRQLRHLDVEQAFVQATMHGEIKIELPKGNQNFLGAVGRPNKYILDGLFRPCETSTRSYRATLRRRGMSSQRLARACTTIVWKVKLRWLW